MPQSQGVWAFTEEMLPVWTAFVGIRLFAPVVKNPPISAGDARAGSIPESGRSPGEGHGLPTPVFLPEEFPAQKSLASNGPQSGKGLNRTERLSFSLSHVIWWKNPGSQETLRGFC